MIWSQSRPIHVTHTSVKEAFVSIMIHDGDSPSKIEACKGRKWKHFFTPAELRVYEGLRHAFRYGQDRVVSNLNTGNCYIVTFTRYKEATVSDSLANSDSRSR